MSEFIWGLITGAVISFTGQFVYYFDAKLEKKLKQLKEKK